MPDLIEQLDQYAHALAQRIPVTLPETVRPQRQASRTLAAAVAALVVAAGALAVTFNRDDSSLTTATPSSIMREGPAVSQPVDLRTLATLRAALVSQFPDYTVVLDQLTNSRDATIADVTVRSAQTVVHATVSSTDLRSIQEVSEAVSAGVNRQLLPSGGLLARNTDTVRSAYYLLDSSVLLTIAAQPYGPFGEQMDETAFVTAADAISSGLGRSDSEGSTDGP